MLQVVTGFNEELILGVDMIQKLDLNIIDYLQNLSVTSHYNVEKRSMSMDGCNSM